MHPHRSRFVTACQQLLALGVVAAVITPASSLISLDVVRQPPASGFVGTQAGQAQGSGTLSAYARVARRTATLPAAARRGISLPGASPMASRCNLPISRRGRQRCMATGSRRTFLRGRASRPHPGPDRRPVGDSPQRLQAGGPSEAI